jgi:hypothetical protein
VSDTWSCDIHHRLADAKHFPENALANPKDLTSKCFPKYQADAPTKPFELPEKEDRLANQTQSPACLATIVTPVVEGPANEEKVVSAQSPPQTELEVGNSPVDHVAQATALEYSGSHPVDNVTNLQLGEASKSNQNKAPLTEDDKRHDAAVDELERLEKDHCDARKQFDDHQVTYASQLFQYFQDHPQDSDDMRDEAFAPIYLDRGKTISGKLSAAEAALKAVRVTAKESGVEDVNFWDQESGFHSVTGEGLGPADHQFLLDTCPRNRVRQWMQRPEKTSKHRNNELQYAVAGAEIDPWESASCRGESSKQRKIDAEDWKRKPLVPKKSSADEQCGAEAPRVNNRDHHGMGALSGKLRGRSRARLESNRKRHLLSMEMQKRSSNWVSQRDSTPGWQFSFIHPDLLQFPDLP